MYRQADALKEAIEVDVSRHYRACSPLDVSERQESSPQCSGVRLRSFEIIQFQETHQTASFRSCPCISISPLDSEAIRTLTLVRRTRGGVSPHISHSFVARRVRRPWIPGARCSARGSVLGQYAEHGECPLGQAQRRRRGLLTRRSRKCVRYAG